MAKVKVLFRCDVYTPKKNGKQRKYKKDIKYNINEDLYNAIGQYCDVVKMKEDDENWENALSKINEWYDDMSKGIKKNHQVTWS